MVGVLSTPRLFLTHDRLLFRRLGTRLSLMPVAAPDGRRMVTPRRVALADRDAARRAGPGRRNLPAHLSHRPRTWSLTVAPYFGSIYRMTSQPIPYTANRPATVNTAISTDCPNPSAFQITSAASNAKEKAVSQQTVRRGRFLSGIATAPTYRQWSARQTTSAATGHLPGRETTGWGCCGCTGRAELGAGGTEAVRFPCGGRTSHATADGKRRVRSGTPGRALGRPGR